VAPALEKLAWKAEVIGTWTLSFPVFVKDAGPFGESAIFPQTFIESAAADPAAVRFVEAFRRRWESPRVDTAVAAAQAFDAVHLLALAIAQAGSTDGPKVKAAMERLEKAYDGATGSYFEPWRADDHEAVTPAQVLWGRVRSGAIVLDEAGGH
jgi:branched-chain amino acid transport system substrate-binding protein